MWRHKPNVKDNEKQKYKMKTIWYLKPYILKSASWIYYELKFQNFDVAFLILLSVYLLELSLHVL